MASEAGKGDRYRPVDREKYREGWERTFGSAPERWEVDDTAIGDHLTERSGPHNV